MTTLLIADGEATAHALTGTSSKTTSPAAPRLLEPRWIERRIDAEIVDYYKEAGG